MNEYYCSRITDQSYNIVFSFMLEGHAFELFKFTHRLILIFTLSFAIYFIAFLTVRLVHFLSERDLSGHITLHVSSRCRGFLGRVRRSAHFLNDLESGDIEFSKTTIGPNYSKMALIELNKS